MTAGPGLDLGRPRELGELFGDAFSVYTRHFGTFFLIAALIVVPVQLVVSGVGLGELTAPYREERSLVALGIGTAVSFFVIAPLTTAATIHALGSLADGERPHAGRSLLAGLEAFAPLFLAVLIAAAGIALGLAALILPGVYLLVRWVFVPQAVIVEGKRGVEALEGSGAIVQGAWWRTFAIVVLVNVAATIPALLVLAPLTAAADAADRQLLSLAGDILAQTLAAPLVALLSTLLYYDLRARRRARLA